MQCAPEATEFGEITQNKATTPFKVTDFGTNRKLMYDFLFVTNTNLPPILHHFQDIAFDKSKSLYLATPLACNHPKGRVLYVISS